MSEQVVRAPPEEEEAPKYQCPEQTMVKACNPMKTILSGVSAAEVLDFPIQKRTILRQQSTGPL